MGTIKHGLAPVNHWARKLTYLQSCRALGIACRVLGLIDIPAKVVVAFEDNLLGRAQPGSDALRAVLTSAGLMIITRRGALSFPEPSGTNCPGPVPHFEKASGHHPDEIPWRSL